MKLTHLSHLWPGVPLALASAALFGATAPLSKVLLGVVDPQLLAGLLYLGAGIGLAGVHLARNAIGLPAPEAPLRRADIPWLAAVILFGGVLGPLFLMLGLNLTDAARDLCCSIWKAWPQWALPGWCFGKTSIGGCCSGRSPSWRAQRCCHGKGGVAVGLGGDFHCRRLCAWGIDNNLTRKLSSADPVQIAMLKGLVAGTVNLALALAQGAALPDIGTILTAE